MTSLALRSWDLLDRGLLCDGWQDAIVRLARLDGRAIVMDGSSFTSRTRDGESRRCGVVAGDVVRSELAWLDDLYRGPLLELAAGAFGRALFAAQDPRIGVNINRLSGPGADYEAHVDSNPVTGLLFVTAHTDDGALVFEPHGEDVARIYPRPGTFLAFDARQVLHRVEPLKTTDERVTVPMNYYYHATEQFRPAGLNEYVYGQP